MQERNTKSSYYNKPIYPFLGVHLAWFLPHNVLFESSTSRAVPWNVEMFLLEENLPRNPYKTKIIASIVHTHEPE